MEYFDKITINHFLFFFLNNLAIDFILVCYLGLLRHCLARKEIRPSSLKRRENATLKMIGQIFFYLQQRHS